VLITYFTGQLNRHLTRTVVLLLLLLLVAADRAMPSLHRLNPVPAAAGQQDDSTLQDLTAGAKKNLVAWASSNGLEHCLCARMEGGKWALQWDLQALDQAKTTQ